MVYSPAQNMIFNSGETGSFNRFQVSSLTGGIGRGGTVLKTPVDANTFLKAIFGTFHFF